MIPLDFPGCYAHSVRLSLAASEIGDRMDAAADIFRRRDVREGTAVVWCNDTTPFSSYPAAADFIISAGLTTFSKEVVARRIRRRSYRGSNAYGFFWSREQGQPPRIYRGPKGKPVKRLADGTRYERIMEAAKQFAPSCGLRLKTAHQRICRALRTHESAFDSRWEAAA